MYIAWDGERSNIVSGVSPMDWAIWQTRTSGTYVYLDFFHLFDLT